MKAIIQKILRSPLKASYYIFLILMLVLLLGLTVRGDKNPMYFQTERDSRLEGPFESSGSTSRFSLVESIVLNGTFFFTEKQAKFSAPDITYYQGKYFSIFTPGVSFAAIPFYILGQFFGIPQFTTYSLNLLLTLFNFFLIIKLGFKFGASRFAAITAGLLFIFATNGLSYATTLTQHQFSTFLILLAIFNAILPKRTILNNFVLGAIFGIGALVDIPNVIAIAPVMIYVFLKHFSVDNLTEKLKLNFKLNAIGLLLGFLPFIILFGYYNKELTGSFTKLGQTIGRSDYPHVEKVEKDSRIEGFDFSRNMFLDSRQQVQSSYILLLSDERGIIYYSPVVLLGLIGFYLVYKNREKRSQIVLFVSVISTIIVMYSMHGDPWGGWSFGPRYMIPVYAILLAGLSAAITRLNRNVFFTLAFILLAGYSLYVNSAGVLTTNSVPPKVEAVALINPIPWTYDYNFQLLDKNESGSLIFNSYLSNYFNAKTFYYIFLILAGVLISINFSLTFFERKRENGH